MSPPITTDPAIVPSFVVTDFTKSPSEIIIQLINFDNGTTLTPTDLVFGNPKPVVGLRNTEVLATATQVSKYSGSVTLTYNRIDLATVPGVRSTNFEFASTVTIEALIALINSTYSINLTVDDYFPPALGGFVTTPPGESLPIEIIAKPNSLIFINKLSLTVYKSELQLSSVIINTVLNGLTYIQPVI